jgi:hypothetical protein
LAEAYVFYSSVTLALLGCTALTLAVFLRKKSKVLNGLSTKVTASVFNRTYVVFDPYPDRRRVIHRFLTALPLVVGAITCGMLVLVWVTLTSGLFLSFVLIIISLNMIVLEETPEVLLNNGVFVKAFQEGAKMAPGDLRVLELTKKAAAKLGKYYLVLCIFFVACAVVLPYAAAPVLQGFLSFLEFLLKLSQPAGGMGWLVMGFLLVTTYVIICFSLSKIKSRLFKYELE